MQKILAVCLIVVVVHTCCLGAPSVADVDMSTRNMSILFIGDSISTGVGASGPANGYTTLITAALNRRHKGYKYEEINLAISGSTLVDQLWPVPNSSAYPYILKKVIRSKPDIVVIQHGTNDNAAGSSIGQFLWSYREIVRTIKEKFPQTKIVCMTICPSWGIGKSTERWLTQANVGIQEIAAMENTLLAHTNYNLKNRREIFPDGIHPNDEGHRIMAASVLKALDENNNKSKNSFDFICDGLGQYRICAYVFEVTAENSQEHDGWICFRDVSKTGFTYISDYSVEITSPYKIYDRDVIIKQTDEDINISQIKSHWNDYTGQGIFSLPPAKGGEITLQIE